MVVVDGRQATNIVVRRVLRVLPHLFVQQSGSGPLQRDCCSCGWAGALHTKRYRFWSDTSFPSLFICLVPNMCWLAPGAVPPLHRCTMMGEAHGKHPL